MLILDVKTHWSSTHQMLSEFLILNVKIVDRVLGRALTYRKAIDSYVAKDRDIRKFDLLDSDWETIKQVSDWLKAFRTATTDMSTTKKPMLSKTLAVFRGLQETIRNVIATLPHSADPSLHRGLVDAHRKLSDYYYKFDESVYYTWAARKSTSHL